MVFRGSCPGGALWEAPDRKGGKSKCSHKSFCEDVHSFAPLQSQKFSELSSSFCMCLVEVRFQIPQKFFVKCVVVFLRQMLMKMSHDVFREISYQVVRSGPFFMFTSIVSVTRKNRISSSLHTPTASGLPISSPGTRSRSLV